ncbi:hypothetical protein Bra3105_15190 [Brachybacterium halotolerans subsp. kimchii]|uniref:hypothetical protein n=1 Tax=Brachybacterium halotolerans TaxID=2795215 RepID=UPI001E3EBBF1|nr:hypothetical protein [Brachybacterium halotolerans]UEJ82169.1 hypothetical protein Bra3105_15190 [Brachybacterium halotolerans subsp. kimchii]
MHPSSPPSSTPSSSAPPGPSSSRRAVTAGAISFLAVLVLIVGGTLGVRAAIGGGTRDADPALFTQKPTADCTTPSGSGDDSDSSGSTVRGGHLRFTRPDGWDYPWETRTLPYMTSVNGYARQVEDTWYSTVNVGSVEWPASEGKYPGDEDAAVTIFQCYVNTTGLVEDFGENPSTTDRRSERTTVDGHDAWIVQATYHFEDSSPLKATSASIVTSIVVSTDDGPQALAADVAADIPEHADGLDRIIRSLELV